MATTYSNCGTWSSDCPILASFASDGGSKQIRCIKDKPHMRGFGRHLKVGDIIDIKGTTCTNGMFEVSAPDECAFYDYSHFELVVHSQSIKPDVYYWQVGQILEKIYESEIHLTIGWMWDGGVDYKIGADPSYLKGEVESTGTSDMGEAIKIIADEVTHRYPDSEFATWYNNLHKA